MMLRLLVGLLLGGAMLGCQAGLTAAVQAEVQSQAMSYYDGQRWREVWVNEREVVEFVPPGQERSSRAAAPAATATLLVDGRGVRIWRLDQAGAPLALSRSLAPANHYSPVFHLSPSGGRRLALSGNIVVRFKPEWSAAQIQAWLSAQRFAQVKLLSAESAIYVLSVGNGLDALEKANAIQEGGEVVYAMPEWWREVSKR
jgi:hypothetical protein